MFRISLIAGSAMALCMSGAASAATSEEVAAKLGAREFIRSISISPAGNQVVIVTPHKGGGETAIVVNLATSVMTPILSSAGGKEQLTTCKFILENRVICQVMFTRGSGSDVERATRWATVSTDGKDIKELSAKTSNEAYYSSGFGGGIVDYNVEGDPDSVLMLRWYEAQRSTGHLGGPTDEGLGVEKVNVLTLNRSVVQKPETRIADFISDGHGNLRVMATRQSFDTGYQKLTTNYFYRPADGGGWQPLSTVTYDGGRDTGFDPIAVDSKANAVYGFDTKGNYQGLYKIALDGSGKETLVLGRDDADVDGYLTIGRDNRLIGASYATEKRHVEYFDPELKQLAADLGKALGGGMQIDILDSTTDEKKLVILAGSDTQPGQLYIYDKTTRQLGKLLPARPELEGMQFGQMKPISYPAADGTMIPAYLTLPPGSDGKNLPAIVLPHGGPDYRDEWGFDWLVQYFAERGFAVLQPEYRGSAGYGNDWFRGNAIRGWKTAIDDINDAGRWLEKSGVAAPGKIAIFGWSYGGYAALQSQVADPDLFKAVVAIAPVTDFDAIRAESVHSANFKYVDAQIGHGSYIEEGSPARHADRFMVPVLLVHGDSDLNVGVGESRLMNDRLKAAGKSVRYIEFKGLDHQLDDPAARTQLLVEAEKTIRQGLGLPQG
jgi:dipeptidyl aminopeptidase/acylaminoacyl peptidase